MNILERESGGDVDSIVVTPLWINEAISYSTVEYLSSKLKINLVAAAYK